MVPKVGREAALEAQKEIKEAIENADMIFIAAGMGGGTGTGASPVVAEIAKESGILTVAVVTTPFKFEGRKRTRLANEGIERLKEHVDTIMIIPNNRLLEMAHETTTVAESFQCADDVLEQAITGLTDLISCKGVINLDFADVKTVIKAGGKAIIGRGVAKDKNRGITAAKEAIKSPLLDDKKISGAMGLIINIEADKDFTLMDAQNAATLIEEAASEDADVIFGMVYDENKKDEVAVTVIATGVNKATFDIAEKKAPLRVKNSFEKNLQISDDRNPEPAPTNVATQNAEPSEFEAATPPSDSLFLSEEEITEVERTPHFPKHLKNVEDSSGEEDLDLPAYIRRQKNYRLN